MKNLTTIHSVFVDPSQTDKVTLDVPSAPKEEFIFRAYLPDSHSLYLIKSLSYLLSFFAFYQLIYSGLSIFYLPTTTSTFLGFSSLASLFLSITIMVWSSRTLAAEGSEAPLPEESLNANLESYNRSLFILIVIRAAASLVIIPNMLTQESQVSDYLTAYGTQPPHIAGLLDSLSTLLPFLELVSLIILCKAGQTVFTYLKEPTQAMQKMIFISNFALLLFSLAIIFHANYLQNYHRQIDLSTLLNTSTITGLKITAIFASLSSFFIWLFNFRAWRIPSLIMTCLIFITMITFGVFTINTLSNTVNIYEAYSNTNNEEAFALKMANVDYHELHAAGCPAKYLFGDSGCPDSMVSKIWETPGVVGQSFGCLNPACAGILAGLYSNPLLNLIGWGFAAIASCLLLTIGGIHSYNKHWLNVTHRKSNYTWLAGLASLVLLFFVMQGVYEKSFIREFIGLNESRLYDESQFQGLTLNLNEGPKTTALWSLKSLFGPKSEDFMPVFSGLNNDAYNELSRTVVKKDYQYAIISKDPTNNLQQLVVGDWLSDFTLFSNEFNSAKLGFINLKHGVKKYPILVLYDPNSAGKALNEVYYSFGLTGNLEAARAKGLIVYATYDASKITHENLLNRATGHDVQTAIVNSAETGSQDSLPLMSTWETPYKDVFKLLTNKKYQFVILKQDNRHSPNVVVDSGLWGATWDDFVKNIDNNKEQVAIIYAGDKGKEKGYLVVYNPKVRAVAQVLADYQLPADVKGFKDLGAGDLKLFVANTKKDLEQQNVIAKAS